MELCKFLVCGYPEKISIDRGEIYPVKLFFKKVGETKYIPLFLGSVTMNSSQRFLKVHY